MVFELGTIMAICRDSIQYEVSLLNVQIFTPSLQAVKYLRLEVI